MTPKRKRKRSLDEGDIYVKKRAWTTEEEIALKNGVNKYGVGKWATILNDELYWPILQYRSNVDLKDKWRVLQSKKKNDVLKIPLKISIGDNVKKKKPKNQRTSYSSTYNDTDENVSKNSDNRYANHSISRLSPVKDEITKSLPSKQLDSHSLNRSKVSMDVSTCTASAKLENDDISMNKSQNILKVPMTFQEDDISSMKESIITLRTPINKDNVSFLSYQTGELNSMDSYNKNVHTENNDQSEIKSFHTENNDQSEIKSFHTYSSSLATIESCKSFEGMPKSNLSITDADEENYFIQRDYHNHEATHEKDNTYLEVCDSKNYYTKENTQSTLNHHAIKSDLIKEHDIKSRKEKIVCNYQNVLNDRLVQDLSLLKEEIHCINGEFALISNTIPLQKILIKYRAFELELLKSFRRIESTTDGITLCKHNYESERGIIDSREDSSTYDRNSNYLNSYIENANKPKSFKQTSVDIYHDTYTNSNSFLSPIDNISVDLKKIVTPMNGFEETLSNHKTPLINNITKERSLLEMNELGLNISRDDLIYKKPILKVSLVKTLKPLLLIPLRVCIFNNVPCSFWFS